MAKKGDFHKWKFVELKIDAMKKWQNCPQGLQTWALVLAGGMENVPNIPDSDAILTMYRRIRTTENRGSTKVTRFWTKFPKNWNQSESSSREIALASQAMMGKIFWKFCWNFCVVKWGRCGRHKFFENLFEFYEIVKKSLCLGE